MTSYIAEIELKRIADSLEEIVKELKELNEQNRG